MKWIDLLKYSLCLLLGMLTLFSCSEDEDEPYDPYKHRKEDEEKLQQFFKTHYYNPKDGAIWTVGNKTVAEGALPTASQLPLSKDPKLRTLEEVKVEFKDDVVAFKMYYYITEEGKGRKPSVYPTRLDSVLVKYVGRRLDSVVFDNQKNYAVWFRLTSLVPGWGFGLQKFKPGIVKKLPYGDYEFTQSGKGFIFFPSGLGYLDNASTDIPKNSPLIFKVDLQNFKSNDKDKDHVPNYKEIKLDVHGNISMMDTDGDDIDDIDDIDDDGDGVYTRDEVKFVINPDKTRTITYPDSDGDGVPDYLDYSPKKK